MVSLFVVPGDYHIDWANNVAFYISIILERVNSRVTKSSMMGIVFNRRMPLFVVFGDFNKLT